MRPQEASANKPPVLSRRQHTAECNWVKLFINDTSEGSVLNSLVSGEKGEEFETVIAYGLLSGYIPLWNEIYSGNATNASKKLMYVICSRAKTNLHLISERGRTTRQGDEYMIIPDIANKTFKYDEI